MSDDLTHEQLDRIIANHESGVQVTGIAVYRQLKVAQEEIAALKYELDIYKTGLQYVLIGGNHLASILLSRNIFPPEQKSYDQVQRDYGLEAADIWIAWKAIIEARDLVARS